MTGAVMPGCCNSHANPIWIGFTPRFCANSTTRSTILKSVSEIIVLEIQKTFDFFRATAGGEQIQKLFMAGGSARGYGVADVLKQELGIAGEELNPFRKIRFDRSGEPADLVAANGPRLAVAVGLALRSFEDL